MELFEPDELFELDALLELDELFALVEPDAFLLDMSDDDDPMPVMALGSDTFTSTSTNSSPSPTPLSAPAPRLWAFRYSGSLITHPVKVCVAAVSLLLLDVFVDGAWFADCV